MDATLPISELTNAFDNLRLDNERRYDCIISKAFADLQIETSNEGDASEERMNEYSATMHILWANANNINVVTALCIRDPS